jgi:hypothetical protein
MIEREDTPGSKRGKIILMRFHDLTCCVFVFVFCFCFFASVFFLSLSFILSFYSTISSSFVLFFSSSSSFI